MNEGPVPSPKRDGPSLVVTLLFATVLLVTVGLLLLSIPAGVYAFFFTQLSTSGYSWMTAGHPVLWIGPGALILPFQVSLGAMFLAVTVIYVLMLAYSAQQGTNPFRALRDAIQSGVASLFKSPFFVTVISIGFLVFTASVIDAVVSGTAPAADPLLYLSSLSEAPLFEELGFRMMIIGLAVALIILATRHRGVLKALWRPSSAIGQKPAGRTMMFILAGLLGFSAVIFGATHVLYGWSSGKFFEATYGGLVLGYVYIKYGFHVSVLTHWGVNYFGSAFAFFGQGVYGIPWDSATKEFIFQQLVDIDLIYVFGLLSFLIVAYIGIRSLVLSRKSLPRIPEVQPTMGIPA
ncbi:MAG: CPBP family glutamic-type intramembrane protease [Thaumarchaeota archaeon]|nr:CPBP family glutamic-type intramembrane protease [Nitrososphaerota archaeon]